MTLGVTPGLTSLALCNHLSLRHLEMGDLPRGPMSAHTGLPWRMGTRLGASQNPPYFATRRFPQGTRAHKLLLASISADTIVHLFLYFKCLLHNHLQCDSLDHYLMNSFIS